MNNLEDLIGRKVKVDCGSYDCTGMLTGIDWNKMHARLCMLDHDEFIPLEDILFITCVDEESEPGIKMSPERFKALLDELDGNSLQTLKEKNARYAQNGDCLHNFRSGADIAGGTPAQACWGYLTKHLVALRDMVERDDFSNKEDFLEKCQDTINYIRFLWCIGNDKIDKTNKKESN